MPYFESGVPVLTGDAAPTTDTAGKLGQIYIETTSNVLYICVAAGNTWKKILTQSDLDTLNTTISDLTSNVDTLEEGLGTLQSTVSTLSSSFESFKTETTTALGNKVDKVDGKGLSTEDFTSAEKNKLAALLPVDDETTSSQVVWSAQKIADEIAAKNVTLYQGTKTDLDTADGDVITQYFADHSSETPKQGDVFIIKTTVDDTDYELSAYMYDGTSWIALTGFVDADKVIFRNNITTAGNYTQVGNITKTQNGTGTFSVKGKSVEEAFTEIFSKRLQPNTPTQPGVSGFALTGAKAVEAGTTVAEAQFGTAVLNPGNYQYGPPTGITATSYSVDRVAIPSSMSQTGIATAASGTDDNGGAGFIIGDGTEANVQANWNETDDTSDAYIQNKPTSLPANGGNADTVGGKSVDDTQDSDQYLWTAAKTKAYADGLLAANDAMTFKGVVNSTTPLPATGYKVGDTYKVGEAGTYAGQSCEVGDMIICVKKYASASASNADWQVIQSNIDGAVTSSVTSSVDGTIAVFDGTTGKIIKTGTKSISDLEYTLPSATNTTLGGVKITSVEESDSSAVESGRKLHIYSDSVVAVSSNVLLDTDELILLGGDASTV